MSDDQFNTFDSFETAEIEAQEGSGGVPTWVWIVGGLLALFFICGLCFCGLLVYVSTQESGLLADPEGFLATFEASNAPVSESTPEFEPVDIATIDPDAIPTLALPTLPPSSEQSELLPTLEVSLDASKSSGYTDSFDRAGDWLVGDVVDEEDVVNATVTVADGVMAFDIFTTGLYWSTSEADLGNGRYEIDVTAIDGVENNGMGLIFLNDNANDDFYLFEISSDGFVWIGYCDEGCLNIAMLVDDGWFASDAINQGLNETNRLAVDILDGEMSFYVNGELVGEGTDGRLSSGAIGVLVETLEDGALTVEFDNFAYTPSP